MEGQGASIHIQSHVYQVHMSTEMYHNFIIFTCKILKYWYGLLFVKNLPELCINWSVQVSGKVLQANDEFEIHIATYLWYDMDFHTASYLQLTT